MAKVRRHILDPYNINGHVVRYSVRLRNWVVDELLYFRNKDDAFHYARTGEDRRFEERLY